MPRLISLAPRHQTDRDAAAIGKILLANAPIRSLNVSDNRISAAGLKEIASGIANGQNTSLAVLNVSTNEVAAEGATAWHFVISKHLFSFTLK